MIGQWTFRENQEEDTARSATEEDLEYNTAK